MAQTQNPDLVLLVTFAFVYFIENLQFVSKCSKYLAQSGYFPGKMGIFFKIDVNLAFCLELIKK